MRTLVWMLLAMGGAAFAQVPPVPVAAPPRAPVPQVREVIRELVLANHILANEGVLDAYGHVSVRDDVNPSHFHLSRSLPPSAVTAVDIIEYDFDAKPVPATAATGYSERFIHAEIYRARPDVKAIIHCHTGDLIPFSISATKLLPVMHMAGFLGAGIPTFEIRTVAGMSDMLIRNAELGKALAETLGTRPAALMRGHGAVVTGSGLHEAVGRSYYMNLNAKLQWQAMQLGGQMTYMEPEEAQRAGAQDGFERAWDFWRRRVPVVK